MDDWDVIKQLGKGSFGTCLLVKRKDNGQHYAMKQISGFSKEDRKSVIKEIDLHRKLIPHCTSPALSLMCLTWTGSCSTVPSSDSGRPFTNATRL